VSFTVGVSALPGCGAVPLSGGGNSPTAVCITNSLGAGTYSIAAHYLGDTNNASSSSPSLNEVIEPPAGTPVNVALSSAGAVATASSTYQAGYPVSAINNNERKGRSGAVVGAGRMAR
jgi:hypothetical protein